MDLNDIDTALTVAGAARKNLADRAAALALTAIAAAVREELPGAAHADIAMVDGHFEPAGAYYDAAGADITRYLDRSGRISLDTRLQPYCALLDAASEETWGPLVTSYDLVDDDAGDIRRLDLAAAADLEPPPAPPARITGHEAGAVTGSRGRNQGLPSGRRRDQPRGPGQAPAAAPRGGLPGSPLRDLMMRSLCTALLEEGYEQPPGGWDQLAVIASHYTGRPVPPVKPSDFDFMRNMTVEQFAMAIVHGKAARYEEGPASGAQLAARPGARTADGPEAG
jgi:hypothetical protein